jgi:phosphatidylserine/phosphatidylglycerophosphate/cardiolipin synthase-like enzyme
MAAQITKATAIANNEVAFLAWRTQPESIPDCLGFNIVREYLDKNGKVTERRPLAAYVAFKGQSNPDWESQNTTIWPVQKFNWRDLTLRRRRDSSGVRPENERVRYCIRAVGHWKNGLEEVKPEPGSHMKNGTKVVHTYQGAPIKLGYLTPAAYTNEVVAKRKRGRFISTFTNGILSTQFLVRALTNAQGKIVTSALPGRLKTTGDQLRTYLAGDVLTTIQEFFARQGGTFHAALYELEDSELEGILAANADRIRLILSDAGDHEIKDKVTKKVVKTLYDQRNEPARAKLRAIANAPASKFQMQDRLFNGSGHIGHNKFVVWSDDSGTPRAVLTGSTNWTWSGVCGQSNNCIVIEDDGVAKSFRDYWQLLFNNPLPMPSVTTDPNPKVDQGDTAKNRDRIPFEGALPAGSAVQCWFSPNMPGQEQPPSAKKKPQPAPPPDMDRLFSLMRKAHSMILFAVFLPSKGGVHSIIEQAIELGLSDTSLQVIGAISDPMAWGNWTAATPIAGHAPAPGSPYILQQEGVNVVRATALTDKDIGRELGNFVTKEILTVGKAIIHDKIVVIDPLDEKNCVVGFGSHNMGFKASYSNDENLVIVRGNAPLAKAYATHVLDVFDHYRFRAAEAQRSADMKASGQVPDPTAGFLDTTDAWQATANRRVSAYFTG